jgi:hypothetical protein
MPLTGPFAALREIAQGLQEAGGKIDDATREAEDAVFEEYQKGFAAGRDPYGERWAPNKQGLYPTLLRTGRLANPSMSRTKDTVKLRPVPYGFMLHAGANGAPDREIVPYRGGSVWEAPIQERIENVVLGYLESLGR